MTEFIKTYAFRRMPAARLEPAVWGAALRPGWPEAQHWLPNPCPTRQEVRDLLGRYMPELLPEYDGLSDAMADLPGSHALIGMHNLAPFWSGCSVTVSRRQGHATLLRNYDLGVDDFQGTFLHEPLPGGGWMISSAEAGWGALDGLNSHGLAVAITFGGRFVVGDGFSVPIIVRYLLQTCRTTAEAAAALRRLPARLAQNFLLVDRNGETAVVYTAPDRETVVEEGAVCCTNHQQVVTEPRHAAFTRTVERFEHMACRTGEIAPADLLLPPLYNQHYNEHFGTLYSAELDPVAGRVRYFWPGAELDLGPDSPEASVTVKLTQKA